MRNICFILFSPFRKGAHRFLTIKKKDGSEIAQAVMTCSLTHSMKHAIRNLIQRFPVTNKERTDLLPRTERGNVLTVEAGMYHCLFWRVKICVEKSFSVNNYILKLVLLIYEDLKTRRWLHSLHFCYYSKCIDDHNI